MVLAGWSGWCLLDSRVSNMWDKAVLPCRIKTEMATLPRLVESHLSSVGESPAHVVRALLIELCPAFSAIMKGRVTLKTC